MSRWDSGQQITFSFISFLFRLRFPLGKYTNVREVSSELMLPLLMLFPCPTLLRGWVRTAAADSAHYRIPSAVSLSLYTAALLSWIYPDVCVCVCVCVLLLLLLLAKRIPFLRLFRLLLSVIFLYLFLHPHPSTTFCFQMQNSRIPHKSPASFYIFISLILLLLLNILYIYIGYLCVCMCVCIDCGSVCRN